MNLLNIVVNNLKRRRSRAAFLLAGLTVSAATAVALFMLGRAITADVTEKLDSFGANIVVVPDSSALTLSYAGITVSGVNAPGRAISETDLGALATIRNAGNIRVVAPKLAGQTTLQGTPVLLAGIRAEDEFRLKRWWHLAGGRRPAWSGEILLGAGAARRFGLRPGDKASLGGETVTVAGTLAETGGQEDGVVFSDLGFAQRLLKKPGRLSLIELAALCTGCPIEDMVSQISGALPGTKVKAMKETLALKMAAMEQFHRFALAVTTIISFVAGLIVLTSMMGAVGERRREIGLFRAVGYRRTHIMRIVLLEATLLGLIGGLTGFALGTAIPRYAAPHLLAIDGLSFAPDPVLGALATTLTALLALLAGLWPALKAAGLDPAEALRDL